MSVIERCPYYRGVRKERLDCSDVMMTSFIKMFPDKFKEKSLRLTNFAFGSYENCLPRFPDEKRPKILRTTSASKFDKQRKHG